MLGERVLTDSRNSLGIGPADGVFYLGRPAWLTTTLLADLQAEAVRQRQDAEKVHVQYYGAMGPVGHALVHSAELESFVTENAVPARTSGCANYQYYDSGPSHIKPHIDVDDFAVNVLIMLKHNYPQVRKSALLLFPHGPQPITVFLEPGEVILFNAKGVVHARTPISDQGDEQVTNMGIGFIPERGIDNRGFWHPVEGWNRPGSGPLTTRRNRFDGPTRRPQPAQRTIDPVEIDTCRGPVREQGELRGGWD